MAKKKTVRLEWYEKRKEWPAALRLAKWMLRTGYIAGPQWTRADNLASWLVSPLREPRKRKGK